MFGLSLGQPSSTNGVWNSKNDTVTLFLDASSVGEIRWWGSDSFISTYCDLYSNISPSNLTVSYGLSQTFIFNTTKGYSFNVLIDGKMLGQISNYTLTNITELHTINVISNRLDYELTVLSDPTFNRNPRKCYLKLW